MPNASVVLVAYRRPHPVGTVCAHQTDMGRDCRLFKDCIAAQHAVLRAGDIRSGRGFTTLQACHSAAVQLDTNVMNVTFNHRSKQMVHQLGPVRGNAVLHLVSLYPASRSTSWRFCGLWRPDMARKYHGTRSALFPPFCRMPNFRPLQRSLARGPGKAGHLRCSRR